VRELGQALAGNRGEAPANLETRHATVSSDLESLAKLHSEKARG